jgi:nucleoid-associated protein YgaU
MVEGDTLQSIAYRELGRPAYWRAIAELNGIDDPLRMTAGTTLLIPSRADAAKVS